MYACHKGQDRLVEILLKKGADPQDFNKVRHIHEVRTSTFVLQIICMSQDELMHVRVSWRMYE